MCALEPPLASRAYYINQHICITDIPAAKMILWSISGVQLSNVLYVLPATFLLLFEYKWLTVGRYF